MATYPGFGSTTCESLIAEADEGLYLAKNRGRNCVIAAAQERARSAS